MAGAPAVPATDTTLYVAWLEDTEPDVVDGYHVYIGPTLDFATMLRRREVTPRTATVATFQTYSELGYGAGDVVCARLTAFNADGDSPPTPGACLQLDPQVTAVLRLRFGATDS